MWADTVRRENDILEVEDGQLKREICGCMRTEHRWSGRDSKSPLNGMDVHTLRAGEEPMQSTLQAVISDCFAPDYHVDMEVLIILIFSVTEDDDPT